MRSFTLSILLVLFVALQAFAGPYEDLLQEFPDEVRSFDATKEPQEIVNQFEKDWNDFVQHGKALPERWRKNYSWSKILNQFLIQTAKSSKPSSQNEILSLDIKGDLSGAHSIENPVLYSQQRIGETITQVLKTQNLSAIVYGGSFDSLAAALKISPSHLKSVPSPYEAWGLKKVFISEKAFADGKPRFVMVIPPSTQYIQHYVKMFQFLGIKVEKTLLNVTDQKKQVEKLKAAFLKAHQQLGISPDVVVLGYYNNFSQLGDIDLTFQKESPIGEGVTLQAMYDQKSGLQYMLIKSDLTIWGESSAFLIEGALALSPKAVVFMGSAGGITPSTPLYSISVPKEFYLEGKNLEISNFIYEKLKSKTPAPGVVVGGRHGHTNSPIEQTKAYVSAKIDQGITSVDVEQDLIAKAVLTHNKKTGQSVQFGAINLITDKPQSHTYHWDHDADLTKIDYQKKSAARELAVRSALLSVRESDIPNLKTNTNAMGVSCKKIYLTF